MRLIETQTGCASILKCPTPPLAAHSGSALMDPRPSSYLVRLSSYLHASRRESGRASHGGPRSPSPLAHRTPDYAAQRRARGARSSTSSHIRHSLCFLSKVFVGQATQVSRSSRFPSHRFTITINVEVVTSSRHHPCNALNAMCTRPTGPWPFQHTCHAHTCMPSLLPHTTC